MTKLLLKIEMILSQGLASLIVLGMVVLLVPAGLFAQSTTAFDDSAITPPNTPVKIYVLDNDTPGTGSLKPPTIPIPLPPEYGVTTIGSDGSITYAPNQDFSSPDPVSFEYKVCDSATPENSCDTATVFITVAIEVPIRVIPKKLNVKKNGVLPVEIRSSGDFEVTTINPESLMLEGVVPLRWNMGKKKLTLKFDAQDIVSAIGEVSNGEEVVLQLTGNLNDASGFAIVGEDSVIIIKKGKPKI